jgi:hypothetical protein
MSTALLLETSQARVLDHVVEPWRAAHPWLRADERSCCGGLRGLICGLGGVLVAALTALVAGEKTQLSQQLLVVVQQAAHRQGDVLGVFTRPLVP